MMKVALLALALALATSVAIGSDVDASTDEDLVAVPSTIDGVVPEVEKNSDDLIERDESEAEGLNSLHGETSRIERTRQCRGRACGSGDDGSGGRDGSGDGSDDGDDGGRDGSGYGSGYANGSDDDGDGSGYANGSGYGNGTCDGNHGSSGSDGYSGVCIKPTRLNKLSTSTSTSNRFTTSNNRNNDVNVY